MFCSNLTDRVSDCFSRKFNRRPAMWADAGGRVNIIGEHTDYHDGFVLPAAIDLRCFAVAAPRSDGVVRIHAVDVGETVEVQFATFGPFDDVDWRSYACGPFWAWRESGYSFCGADVAVGGDVPHGGGLSSSAAIEVALTGLASVVSGVEVPDVEVARIARLAENRFCRVPCGIMDQTASACGQAGKALLLDCRSLEISPVEVWSEWVLVVADSGVRHSLAAGEYAARQRECAVGMEVASKVFPNVRAARDLTSDMLDRIKSDMPGISYRRLRHVVSENERTVAACKGLRTGDARLVGSLMAGSHSSLAGDYQVSCRELDILVELACRIDGCVGSRLTGAGFGGNTVNLVCGEMADSFCAALEEKYRERTGIDSAVRIVRPAKGLETGIF